MNDQTLSVRHYPDLQSYPELLQAMQDFTKQRIQTLQNFTKQSNFDDTDELWVLEHSPVFTLGQAGKKEHVLAPADIPVIQSDRGGQVTYHGPGQLVVYLMLNIERKGYHIRQLVCRIEEAMIQFLQQYGILGERKPNAPGIYVEGAKIGSIGLRIRRGFSYHGLSFNVDMDLAPFSRINPCGYPNLKVTQLRDLLKQRGLVEKLNFASIQKQFIQVLAKHLD